MTHSKLRAAALACLLLMGTLPALSTAQVDIKADLILSHGEIYASGGWAQAMAVKDGVILAVGDEAAVNQYKTGETEVIDLNGAAVLPGLHDMHVHPMGSGLQRFQCRFEQGSALQKVLDTIAECVAKRGKGEWITGGQWDVASLGVTPHRSYLDRVSPDNPVVLSDISGHSTWANSKALEGANITRATAAPPGGVIERDDKGEPTGVMRESAGWLLRGNVPPYTPEQNAEALTWSLGYMLSEGITSLTDAGVNDVSMQAYATLADRGQLKQRVRGCIMWRPTPFTAGQDAPDPVVRRHLYARDRFSPDCIKMVLDGVPTDGHTAAMVEAYGDAGGMDEARAKGILMTPQDVLDKAVTDFDARGLTVKFHAAGDAAVRAGLNAIAAARKANGFSGILHDIGHNSFVQMSDIRRAKDIAATFEMSPYIWYPNPIIPDIAKAIGPKRMQRWIPVKDAIDSGALVVPGSDWAVVPSVSPWIAIETLVTRQKPGGGGEVLGAQERITLQQAIDLFTINSAIQMGHRDKAGSIGPGMLADVIVLDRNPFKIPITEVHKTKVKMTVINGEIAYRWQP